jgi:8-oxo-dGTP diphosphatase
MEYTYKYPRLLTTVDAIIFLRESPDQLTKILLIQRKNEPYKDFFALPGGFVEMDELLKDAAERELFEETGLHGVELTQLAAFDKIDRDPRDRNISVVFYGFTTPQNSNVSGSDDAENAEWYNLNELPPLAFDHAEVIEFAKCKLGIH